MLCAGKKIHKNENLKDMQDVQSGYEFWVSRENHDAGNQICVAPLGHDLRGVYIVKKFLRTVVKEGANCHFWVKNLGACYQEVFSNYIYIYCIYIYT